MPDRRALLRGAGAAAAVALCGLPAVASSRRFGPRAFCNDLIDAGFRITVCRPVPTGLDGDRDRPGFHITPANGNGFGPSYCEVMRRWSAAMDACPDHVDRVVAYAERQLA